MQTNRRKWLRQVGLGIAGLSIAPLDVFASPRPYAAPEPATDNLLPILLRSNENPYGPSPMARLAMAEHVTRSNRYDWDQTSALIDALAAKHHLTAGNILLGAGSTTILDLAAQFAAAKKGSFVMADPTYNYWTAAAEQSGLAKILVPLTADKKHDLPAMLRAIRPDTQLVYICNPNNPTGTLCNAVELRAFIKEATKKTMVLLDEAYLDFTEQQSMLDLIYECKNLVLAKTFSKIYGMAGARVGYAIAHPSTIEQLSQLQSTPNSGLSVVSVAGAIASLKDDAFVKETAALNEKVKAFTMQELKRLKMDCIPSATNFLYFSLANYSKDFFEQLKTHQILGTKIYEEQGKWTRITIGTMPEMQEFIKAIG